MRELLYILCIYRYIIFFSFNSLIGKVYEGRETSNTFIIFTIAIDIIVILTIIYDLMIKRRENVGKYLIIGAFLVVIYLIYLFEGVKATPLITGFLISFVPSSFVALSIAERYSLRKLVRWFDLLMLFLTASSVIGSNQLINGTNIVLSGGASYQAASYIAAFAFTLNIFILFFGTNYNDVRIRVFKHKFYYLLSIALIPFQFYSILLSGGRGGFVLFAVAFIVLSLFKFKGKYRKSSIFTVIIASILIFLISDLVSSIAGDTLTQGKERVFSYFSSTGIDISKTSERDIVYSTALDYISKKPIVGYGIFKYYEIVGYNPHNIFLEIMLQGGIILLLFFLYLFVVFFNKCRQIIKFDNSNIAIIPLVLYPFTNLMFSGTYLGEGMFSFVIVYVLFVSVPFVKEKIV